MARAACGSPLTSHGGCCREVERRGGKVLLLRCGSSRRTRPPIPAFPRMRVKEQGGPAASTPVAPPPPSAGEGWGGGKVRPLRRKSSRPTPPPSRPSPACGGRSRAAQPPPRPWPPPPVRGGGLGWGQSPTAAPQILASDTAPIPAFPRMRGKEQGCPAPSTPVAPLPPSAGEGWGGGKVRPP